MSRKAKECTDGQVIQYTTLKVRLYPTPAQAELFEKTFGCCRYIWNQMLSDQQRFYNETGAHFIPTPAKYKNGAPFLKEVDYQALTREYNKLAQAFRVFFKSPEDFRYPKFKRKKDDREKAVRSMKRIFDQPEQNGSAGEAEFLRTQLDRIIPAVWEDDLAAQ